MPLTEYCCPLCPSNDPGQIHWGQGAITCQKNPAHVWRDVAEFAQLKPEKKFKVEQAKMPPQENHVKMTVMVPLGVKQKLETQWVGNLEETVAGVLTMMSEGESLMVPKSDLQRMKERLGKVPESSAELFGLIYALGLQKDEAVDEAAAVRQDLAAYEGMNKGSVVVNLGDNFGTAQEKARSQEPPEPLKVFCERVLRTAISENWV
jgi:hypothetical protein